LRNPSLLCIINFFRLYAAAAIKICFWADLFPLVYAFLMRMKHGNVPSTGSTAAERSRLIRFPFAVAILSRAAS
jgi:hypothetical protein